MSSNTFTFFFIYKNAKYSFTLAYNFHEITEFYDTNIVFYGNLKSHFHITPGSHYYWRRS